MTKITKIDKKRSACAHALMIMIPENVCVFQMASVPLRKGLATKSDEFSEECQGGGVIFNPKIGIADFGNQGFWSMKLIQNSNIRV